MNKNLIYKQYNRVPQFRRESQQGVIVLAKTNKKVRVHT